MRSAIVGFVVGAACLQMQAALLQYSILIFLIVLACALGVLSRRIVLSSLKILVRFVVGALLGFVWATLFAQYYLSQELSKELEGKDVTIIGTIGSMPSYFERGVRFNFSVEKVLSLAGKVEGDLEEIVPAIPGKLALSWYTDYDYSASRTEQKQIITEVRPGERWQFTVRLRRPHGNANPQGFDYEMWLLEQNIRATGYIRSDLSSVQKNVRLESFVLSSNNVIERCRNWLRERVQRALLDQPYAGVIVALVVGDQRAISQSDFTVVKRTGISNPVLN
jgi:competence protein ComEC